MAFTPQDLLKTLPDPAGNYVVGYSGGMDSHVLLQGMTSLMQEGWLTGTLRAVHVHHGLSEQADHWQRHCQEVCKRLAVPLVCRKVMVSRDGAGLEQAAREARMAVFMEVMEADDYLLTAHHQDDQMETLLFRLMRGTGVKGMAGIVRSRSLGTGTLFRPLLDYPRSVLEVYANSQGLSWIEDDSNADVDLDRNFLRHSILPLLETRWPGYRKSWQRFAGLCADSERLQHDLGMLELAMVQRPGNKLSVSDLLALPPYRRANVLRSWFLKLEAERGLPVPDQQVILDIIAFVLPAREDASPVVSWQKAGKLFDVRRFGDTLSLLQPDDIATAGQVIPWPGHESLVLPGNLGTLSLEAASSHGFMVGEGDQLEVRFRMGGEKARPIGRKTRSLKKWLQDFQVPPWERDRVPLVYLNGELTAVGDFFICESPSSGALPRNVKKMFRIQWQKPDLNCGS